MTSKEQYLADPCRISATAFWKLSEFEKPDNIQIIHEKDYTPKNFEEITKYFRLFHDLKNITLLHSKEFSIVTVELSSQIQIVANILSTCYNTHYSLDEIVKWSNYSVFDSSLWIFAIDNASQEPVALGIADFDSNIKEGSLEWIQVLPQYRRKGLGQMIVNELLFRLKDKADFVTVSGMVDNESNPDLLYRKCGFTGNDIWYIISCK